MEQLGASGFYDPERENEIDIAASLLANCLVCEQEYAGQMVGDQANTEGYRFAIFMRSKLTAIRLNLDYTEVLEQATHRAMRAMEDHGWMQQPGETLKLPVYVEEYVPDLPEDLRIIYGVDAD